MNKSDYYTQQRADLLAQFIIPAIENPQLAELGERSYRLVKQLYCWDSVVAKTYQIYQNSVKKMVLDEKE